MATMLPMFISYGPDRPNSYSVLKKHAMIISFGATKTSSTHPHPDPLYKLPEMRPPREILLGPPKDGPAEPKISNPAAKVQGSVSGKGFSSGKGLGLLKVLGSKLASAIIVKPVAFTDNSDFEEEDSEGYGWFSRRPEPEIFCSGSLGGKKLEPV